MQRFLHAFKSRAVAAALAALATGAYADSLTLVSIQSMTGPAAFAGAVFQQAIQLAMDEANAKGGIHGSKVVVAERDDAGDKGQAINLSSQAIDRDKALLVLGPTATADSLPVAPVFNEKKTPFIPFAGSDAILKAGPWTLKFRQAPDVDGPVLARYMLDKTPVRKVALVFDRTNEALIEFKNTFRDPFKAGGGAIAAEEAVVSADTNFLPLATKLKSLDVDAVYLSVYAEQAGNIATQLRKAGVPEKVRIIGSLAIVSPKFLNAAGKSAEGVIAISDYVPGMDRPLNKAFDAAWRARYKSEPDSYAATGYSQAQVVLAALKEAGPNPTREKVRDAYMRLRDVPVVVGSGVWNHTERRPRYGALVLAVKDGQFVIAP